MTINPARIGTSEAGIVVTTGGRKNAAYADIVVDLRSSTISRGSMTAKASPIELRTAAALLANLDVPLSTERLVEHIWGDREDGGPLAADRCLQVYITRLRHLLDALGMRIESLRGHGYVTTLVPVVDRVAFLSIKRLSGDAVVDRSAA